MQMWLAISLLFIGVCMSSDGSPQVWDVDRLIRARNPDAVFSTTERPSTTWQTLRSITYNPLLEEGSVGSASVQEASLVRRVKPTEKGYNSSGSQLRNGLASIFFAPLLVFLLSMSIG